MGAVTAAEAHTEHVAQATPENWMYPPADGWTYDQIKELVLPFDWELMDGNIVVRGATSWWHDRVRNQLYFALELAQRPPYLVDAVRWTMVNDHDVPRPDVVVYDRTNLDIQTLECTPIESVVLAVEVVSPGSRKQDRFSKPGMYAEAGVDYYWRVERGEDGTPVVHEFWRHHETGVYAPSPEQPTHLGKLVTSVPFPVEMDLRAMVKV